MDFAVFPYLKSFLRGQRFNLQELRQEVLNIISRMKPEQLVRILICRVKRWPRRSKKVDFIQCLGNVINFRSDDPGISQYHFAFDKIIPIYALILIIIRILIKKNHEFNENNGYIHFIHVCQFLSKFTHNPRKYNE